MACTDAAPKEGKLRFSQGTLLTSSLSDLKSAVLISGVEVMQRLKFFWHFLQSNCFGLRYLRSLLLTSLRLQVYSRLASMSHSHQQRSFPVSCPSNLCVSPHSLPGISLIFSRFSTTSIFNLCQWVLLEQRLSFLAEKGKPNLTPSRLMLCRQIIALWLQNQSHNSV